MILFRMFLLAIFLLSGCSQQSVATSPPQTIDELVTQLKAQPSRTKVKLLFVVSAKKGTISRINSTGNHILTIAKEDLLRTIAFTDRPQRLAYDMSPAMLLSIWHSGKDSFAIDPPNAVLLDDDDKIAITTLSDMIDDSDVLTFKLNRNAYKEVDAGNHPFDTELHHPTLVIDSSIITVAGVAGLLRAGAQACAEVECYWALAGA
tara:strand:- start:598 stop:1212 length:615 start_codon:yes stop_codon:yes gene_type:complete